MKPPPTALGEIHPNIPDRHAYPYIWAMSVFEMFLSGRNESIIPQMERLRDSAAIAGVPYEYAIAVRDSDESFTLPKPSHFLRPGLDKNYLQNITVCGELGALEILPNPRPQALSAFKARTNEIEPGTFAYQGIVLQTVEWLLEAMHQGERQATKDYFRQLSGISVDLEPWELISILSHYLGGEINDIIGATIAYNDTHNDNLSGAEKASALETVQSLIGNIPTPGHEKFPTFIEACKFAVTQPAAILVLDHKIIEHQQRGFRYLSSPISGDERVHLISEGPIPKRFISDILFLPPSIQLRAPQAAA